MFIQQSSAPVIDDGRINEPESLLVGDRAEDFSKTRIAAKLIEEGIGPLQSETGYLPVRQSRGSR